VTRTDVDAWIRRFAEVVAERRDELTRLDQAIGDGDHGTNMDRGMRKAVERLQSVEGEQVGAALKVIGMALISSVGGAGGPLYGTLFLQMASSAGDRAALDPTALAEALDAGVRGVQARGKAQAGDKTMLDALLPAAEALRAAAADGADEGAALRRAADAAREGMEATVDLVARKGRASYLGERSRGHPDPGATSSHLLIASAAEAMGGTE
jgi:dihydroxyacetone kinase-like protein